MIRRIKRLLPRPLINAYHFCRAVLAVALYGYPARRLTVIGVTGTDGKTTTSHMLYSILRQAGHAVSLISTTGAVIYGSENIPLGLHVTTPDPFELQRFLRDARRVGSDTIVLETTSHGLAQHRVWGCNYRVGVVTNITPEHLDYHGSYERLLRDKARLLRGVEASILNRDDSSHDALLPLASGKIVTYGLSTAAEVRAVKVQFDESRTSFEVPALDMIARTRFLGDYNVLNALAAAAAASALGIEAERISAGLAEAKPPPGRLEPVERGQPFQVLVDFAHTSNSLENVLHLLRGLARKRLIVVFGCAGERDPGKRFPMGASAGRWADLAVLTAEDPRTEDLEAILDEIARGVESQGGRLNETYYRVPDREQAIAFAILKLAKPGDIVVTCGKAHEKSMCYGAVEYPWDEFVAVHAALDRLELETGPGEWEDD